MEIQVMAIGNVTPDSFYSQSRLQHLDDVLKWAEQALKDGANILDIGGCSTRPNGIMPSAQEEWNRIEPALRIVKESFPTIPLSLDTFRHDIAQRAIEMFGKLIINDVSGGNKDMYEVVRYWDVPYVWTLRGQLNLPETRPEIMNLNLILDPGFGFTGGVENDYKCLREMDSLIQYHKPILIGVSRKSMLYKPLGITPEEALTPTQVAQFYALEKGATIIRTHDVMQTMQTITLYNNIYK